MKPVLAGNAEYFCLWTCPVGGCLTASMFGSCWSGCVCTPALNPPFYVFVLLWPYKGVAILEMCSEAHWDKMVWEICSRTSQQLGLDLLSPFHMLLGVISSTTPLHLEGKCPEQIQSIPWLWLLLVPTGCTWAVSCWQRNTWKSLGVSLLQKSTY